MATENISLDSEIERCKHILASELDDQVVMMDINEGAYFSMKGPSGRIWELTQSTTSVRSIFDKLLDEYDVDADRCRKELLALLDDMLKANLIKQM